jgi:hypothetical protein
MSVCWRSRGNHRFSLTEKLDIPSGAAVGTLLQARRLPTFAKVKRYIPATGREGPWGCETSRLPHFLDSRLTDGGAVVSLTPRPPFTPRKITGYSFRLETEAIPRS